MANAPRVRALAVVDAARAHSLAAGNASIDDVASLETALGADPQQATIRAAMAHDAAQAEHAAQRMLRRG